ncbi:MAG: RidA family protein [Rhodospirillales bacterium]
MAGRIDARLKELNIELPTLQPTTVAKILPYTMANGFLFLSGQIPQWNGERRFIGKLGREFTTAEGQQAARLSMLNVLAAAKLALGGDLDRVAQVMKLVGFVNCMPSFVEVPHVVNGASELVVDIFGDRGRHARSAVGMATMPFDVAIEVEAVFLVD